MNDSSTIALKHKDATKDYNEAYNIVSTASLSDRIIYTPQGKVKTFRKYISDLAGRNAKRFATRSIDSATLSIVRIE